MHTKILKDPEKRTYFVTINFEHSLKYSKQCQPYKNRLLNSRFSSLYADNVGQRDEGRKEKEDYLPVVGLWDSEEKGSTQNRDKK